MAEAGTAGGPIGPDTLRLPGSAAHLRQASQGLHDLVALLDRTGQRLKQASPQGDAPGKIVRALAHVAQRTATVLDHDVDILRNLASALDHEGDVLRDAQSGTLPELRSRWHAARADLAGAVAADAQQARIEAAGHGGSHGGGHGTHHGPGAHVVAEPFGQAHDGARHHDAVQIARDLDAELLGDYEHLFHHWLGATFREPGGGAAAAGAMLVDGPLDQGMRRYRHSVRAVLEDFAGALRRVEAADQPVAGKLHRNGHEAFAQVVPAAASEPLNGVSSPTEVQRLAHELDEARVALHQVSDRLENVRLDIRGGRMLPHGERVGSTDGFKHEWEAHLDGLRQALHAVGRTSEAVLRRLQHSEEECAHDIRRAGRADG